MGVIRFMREGEHVSVIFSSGSFSIWASGIQHIYFYFLSSSMFFFHQMYQWYSETCLFLSSDVPVVFSNMFVSFLKCTSGIQ